MRELWENKIYAKDSMTFHKANRCSFFSMRDAKGKKWLWSTDGPYFSKKEAIADKPRLKALGFSKIETIQICK